MWSAGGGRRGRGPAGGRRGGPGGRSRRGFCWPTAGRGRPGRGRRGEGGSGRGGYGGLGGQQGHRQGPGWPGRASGTGGDLRPLTQSPIACQDQTPNGPGST